LREILSDKPLASKLQLPLGLISDQESCNKTKEDSNESSKVKLFSPTPLSYSVSVIGIANSVELFTGDIMRGSLGGEKKMDTS
jgi:hypothetical protein